VNFRPLGNCLLGHFSTKFTQSALFWVNFFLGKISVLMLTKNGLGPILGEFFKNSSGHPACKQSKGCISLLNRQKMSPNAAPFSAKLLTIVGGVHILVESVF
jgi:hypothetical protein